jgi:hypothetical protein
VARRKERRFYRPQSALVAHQETIEAYFADHPPASVNQACAVLLARTGIKRAPTQVRRFLHRCGLRCRRVGSLPAKAERGSASRVSAHGVAAAPGRSGGRAAPGLFCGCRAAASWGPFWAGSGARRGSLCGPRAGGNASMCWGR